jgi:hypothetical protein
MCGRGDPLPVFIACAFNYKTTARFYHRKPAPRKGAATMFIGTRRKAVAPLVNDLNNGLHASSASTSSRASFEEGRIFLYSNAGERSCVGGGLGRSPAVVTGAPRSC